MINLEQYDLPEIPFVAREEALAIETNEFLDGIEEYSLMRKAGESVANIVNSKYSFDTALIIAGSGNNGGDGIVVADLIDCDNVTLLLLKPPKTVSSKKALADLKNNVQIEYLNQTILLDEALILLQGSDLVIDAVFGIGLKSQVKGEYNKLLEAFAKIESKIVSIDLPSGLDCNSGEWHGPEFTPSMVVTMQHMKKGLLDLGEDSIIEVSDIGIRLKSSYIVGQGHLSKLWKRRNPESHKGQNGRVMVVGGSDEFTGAPVLSGSATLRCGVDTLRIAIPETIRDIVASYSQDFIAVKVKGERLTSKEFKKFLDLTVNRHDVVAVGMGMSNHPQCFRFTLDLFKSIQDKVRVVLDADAIRAFRKNTELLEGTKAIITPHRAELRTMLSEQIPTNISELIQFLMERAKQLGIIILLKGRIDIITDGTRILFNETGHSGMTVGGTGDVLAGVVAAANCFIEDRFLATAVGAYLMGKAGEEAAKKYGNSLLASDVVQELPKVLIDHGL